MFLYTAIAALVAIVGGILLATKTKKDESVVYGKLDRAGRITNIALGAYYVLFSPVYLFLGMISEPRGEGVLFVLGVLVALLCASASLFCGLGLGASVALRKKGRSRLSFAVQFAGFVGIGLAVLLYALFVGTLLSPLN